MAINLAISFSHPDAIAHRVRYQRIDNTTSPAWINVVPNPITSPAAIATNIPSGQYNIGSTPLYADGRVCDELVTQTGPCLGLISINAYQNAGALIVQYLAPSQVPKVRITVGYPNGGSSVNNYVNDGNPITIGLPANLYGNYTVNGQSVCDEISGFYSAVSTTVTVAINAPDSFVQISNTNTGVGGTRTQIYQIGNSVTPGVTYNLEVYSHPVSVVANSGETPSSMAVRMAAAINATTNVQWNSAGSAPSSGTNGFPPTATASGSQVSVTLNYQNQFAAYLS